MFYLNDAIVVPFIAWFVAQSLKVLFVLITDKRLNFKRFVETGGMPSSHSALVVSLATVVGRICGVQSVEFAIALIFAGIIMYDASGVRRAAGKQAEALNKLIEEFYVEKPRVDERLKELLGHTPTEVFVGGGIGFVIGMFL